MLHTHTAMGCHLLVSRTYNGRLVEPSVGRRSTSHLIVRPGPDISQGCRCLRCEQARVKFSNRFDCVLDVGRHFIGHAADLCVISANVTSSSSLHVCGWNAVAPHIGRVANGVSPPG
jgi:hypothetical protein